MARQGFSLVELAIAVAVLAVALTGLLALMPSGIGQFRTAMDTTISAQIAQRLLSDAQQTDFDLLVDRGNLPRDPLNKSYCPERFSFRGPKVKEGRWRYFDEQGNEIVPKAKDGMLSPAERRVLVYQVNTRIRPRAVLPTLNESNSQIAQVTVQVLRNPSLIEVPLVKDENSPEHNLVQPTGRVPIFTYCALVGKNQEL